jgi:hypothetical protein
MINVLELILKSKLKVSFLVLLGAFINDVVVIKCLELSLNCINTCIERIVI